MLLSGHGNDFCN